MRRAIIWKIRRQSVFKDIDSEDRKKHRGKGGDLEKCTICYDGMIRDLLWDIRSKTRRINAGRRMKQNAMVERYLKEKGENDEGITKS